MLNTAQLQTLKAHIASSPDLNSQPNSNDGAVEIARLMNITAVPDYFVWQTNVNVKNLMRDPAFDWTRVDNLTVGKARIWEFMTAALDVNPSLSNIRQGINTCFSAAQDDVTRQAVFNQCQRKATRGERLYTVGTGTSTSNTGTGPGLMTFEGNITSDDVQAARELP